MRKPLALCLALACLASAATALEIPVTVKEHAGLDRVDNHVVAGIPLPEGAYKDVAKFGLVGPLKKHTEVQFVVRERWLKDDSIRFMTVHFAANLKAGEAARFVVTDNPPVRPPVPYRNVRVEETAEEVTVVATSGLRFTVKKGDWHLFETLGADGAKLKSPGKVIFKAEYGKTPVAGGIARPPQDLAVSDAKPVVEEIKVEEKGP
ncbi:MAG: hypothetical protein ACYTGB_10615, partial [Planctomycetota bacterium]